MWEQKTTENLGLHRELLDQKGHNKAEICRDLRCSFGVAGLRCCRFSK